MLCVRYTEFFSCFLPFSLPSFLLSSIFPFFLSLPFLSLPFLPQPSSLTFFLPSFLPLFLLSLSFPLSLHPSLLFSSFSISSLSFSCPPSFSLSFFFPSFLPSFFLFFLYFWNTVVWTQSLTLIRQTLPFEPSSQYFFALVIFQIGSHNFTWASIILSSSYLET
jgi:hypothetical protein